MDIDASDVYINTYATQAEQREERIPLRSVALIDYFVERLAQVGGPLGDTPDMGFYTRRQAGAALRWNNLSSSTVNTLVARAMLEFANHDLRELPRSFLASHRNSVATALLLGLRSEAELRLYSRLNCDVL